MRKSKHTPGEWRSSPLSFHVHAIQVDAAGPTRVPIADAYFFHDTRLIAAAPTMLEALKAALAGRVIRDGDVVDQIRAAIAAAEGRDDA